jgi:hypothetical protein
VQRHLGRSHTARPHPDLVSPRRRSWRQTSAAAALRTALAGLLLLAALGGPLTQFVIAKGNTSTAFGFLEDAQNDDGGFGSNSGQKSSPVATLWVAVAMLSSGRNPVDEFNKGGDSLDDYLRGHLASYTSLESLGRLAMVQGASTFGPSRYGDPGRTLKDKLSQSAVNGDPSGVSFAVLGLLASGYASTAKQYATLLLDGALKAGGWGAQGTSDNRTTALVLQALAAAGVADRNNPVVKAAVKVLRTSQINDGSITRTVADDRNIASGDVPATAYTIQAIKALGISAGSIKTKDGKTVRYGLTQSQTGSGKGRGGLSTGGSVYGGTPPSVAETAQAYAAFNGSTFPLQRAVPPQTSGPPKQQAPAKKHATPHKKKQAVSKHESTGTSDTGAADTTSDNTQDAGAFQQSATGQQGTATKGTTDRAGSSSSSSSSGSTGAQTKTKSPGSPSGGDSVSGTVVGATSAPKLTTRRGQSPGGMSDATKATLGLVGLLVAVGILGAWADTRRPRADGRSQTHGAIVAIAAFLAAARARGAIAPFAVAVVGLLLISVPFATGMWDRAPQGAKLVRNYAPYMTAKRVASYQRDLGQLNGAVHEGATKAPAVLYPTLSPTAARTQFAKDGPMFATVQSTWPTTYASLHGVIGPIVANRTGYQALAALPPFTMFPWFFVIPGGLLVLLGGIALIWPRAWVGVRFAVLAVAIGLMVAPSVFHMWERAPKAAQLVSDFKRVETRGTVVRVQRDFGQVTTVQGAVGGELVPALRKNGVTATRLDAEFPAIQAFTKRWVQILNNLTPVIGVMSDNVTRFQSVAQLPPFTVFPWLFVIPGILLLGALLLARIPRQRRRLAASTQTGTPVPPGATPMPTATPQPAAAAAPAPTATSAAPVYRVGSTVFTPPVPDPPLRAATPPPPFHQTDPVPRTP